MSTDSAYELRVSREALERMAGQLVRASRKAKRATAIFSFDGQALQVAVSGMRLTAPARGTWAQKVRVEAGVIQAIRGLTGQGEEVLICVRESRIHFDDDVSYSCELLGPPSGNLEIPLTEKPPELLARTSSRPGEEVEGFEVGWATDLAAARRVLAIEKAFRNLVDFGVTRQDLVELVDRRLPRSTKP